MASPCDDAISITKNRFRKGLCVCCGQNIEPYGAIEPKGIAEGVMMCGWCIDREHDFKENIEEIIDMLVAK